MLMPFKELLQKMPSFLSNTLLTTGGGALQNSQFVQGLINFSGDLSSVLLLIGAPVVGAAIGVFALCRACADENKKVMWLDKMKGAGIGLIFVLGASAITGLISSYFSG